MSAPQIGFTPPPGHFVARVTCAACSFTWIALVSEQQNAQSIACPRCAEQRGAVTERLR